MDGVANAHSPRPPSRPHDQWSRLRNPAHWRYIGDREPDAAPVQRDKLTMDLFGEIETICALASMPDGAVIAGALLDAARKEWR